MSHIPDIQFNPTAPRNAVASMNLCPSGNARFHQEPFALPPHELRGLRRQHRTRANQRHLAMQDVPQLREFIETPATEPFTETCTIRFSMRGCPFRHRAEFD